MAFGINDHLSASHVAHTRGECTCHQINKSRGGGGGITGLPRREGRYLMAETGRGTTDSKECLSSGPRVKQKQYSAGQEYLECKRVANLTVQPLKLIVKR